MILRHINSVILIQLLQEPRTLVFIFIVTFQLGYLRRTRMLNRKKLMIFVTYLLSSEVRILNQSSNLIKSRNIRITASGQNWQYMIGRTNEH